MKAAAFVIGKYEGETLLILNEPAGFRGVEKISVKSMESGLYDVIIDLRGGEERLISDLSMEVTMELMGREVPVMTLDEATASILDVSVVKVELAG